MDISSVVGIASTYEAARSQGVQQASATVTSQETQRDTAKKAEELDLKRTDVVPGTNDQQGASGTKDKRLDIRV